MAAPKHVNTQALSPGDRRIYDERFGKADTLQASDAYHRAKNQFDNSRGDTVLVSRDEAEEITDRDSDLPDTQRQTRGQGGSIAHLQPTEAEGVEQAEEGKLATENTTAAEFYDALGKGARGEESDRTPPEPATPKVGKDVEAKEAKSSPSAEANK